MVSLSEERMKILQMLEEGKISPDEAATLLRALDGGQRSTTPTMVGPGSGNRYLRVQVTDLNSGKPKVNVTIPMGLVGAGLRIAERFAPEFEGLDLQELEELLSSGAIGKMVEVRDEEDNELVEVYVE